MGLWSFLFPSDEDLLQRAKKKMADGRFADARKDLMHCKLPEAEVLYDQCSAAIDKGERVSRKKQLVAEGFHGWKIEVTTKSAKLKNDLTKIIAEELEREDVDLGLPEIDEEAFKRAVSRAQTRVRSKNADTIGVRLVPVMDEKLEQRLRSQER